MDELPADAEMAVDHAGLSSRDPMAHRADPAELLDIDVDELTRLFPLVTADGLRLQSAQLVQAQTTQNAADGGRRDADLGRNLPARPALAPQLLDLLDDLLRRRPAHHLAHDPLSTVNGQPGILMDVHSVLRRITEASQPQLPRSGPTGQPIESSQLAHHVTRDRVQKNLSQIPQGSAAGVDGQTVAAAKESFEKWIEPMLQYIHRQGYRAPDIRRVYIPKPGKTEKRPLGVPTVSDRALQRSTAEVLSAI